MSSKITPCIRYNAQAQAAAALYCSVFPNSKVMSTRGVVTEFSLMGTYTMLGLDGGPMYSPNPSISFSVWLKDEAQTKRVWDALVE